MRGGRKVQITITPDADITECTEHLVAAGKAASVSAVFNDAVTGKHITDQRALVCCANSPGRPTAPGGPDDTAREPPTD
ncbi:hypothetical protein [Microbispora bryophytorum]|uniref:hypothetical protein n=1 Tax=Microbispora bryophytorum TaxID=1460882 RepID=UPI0037205862